MNNFPHLDIPSIILSILLPSPVVTFEAEDLTIQQISFCVHTVGSMLLSISALSTRDKNPVLSLAPSPRHLQNYIIINILYEFYKHLTILIQ